MTALPLIVAIVALPALYFIETMSWAIKAQAKNDQIGMVIARTNILLYGSRMFFFVYSSLIYFFIESGLEKGQIYLILIISFLVTCLSQYLVLKKEVVSRVSNFVLGYSRNVEFTKSIEFSFFIKIFIVNVIFTLAVIAPVAIALNFFSYRMTATSAGPILNSIGTWILLIYVDTKLYASMDENRLNEKVFSYVTGRITGFAIGVLILMFLRVY